MGAGPRCLRLVGTCWLARQNECPLFLFCLTGHSFINSPPSYGYSRLPKLTFPRPADPPRTATSVPPLPAGRFGSIVSRLDRSRAHQPSSARHGPGTTRQNARRRQPKCPTRPASPPQGAGWNGRYPAPAHPHSGPLTNARASGSALGPVSSNSENSVWRLQRCEELPPCHPAPRSAISPVRRWPSAAGRGGAPKQPLLPKRRTTSICPGSGASAVKGMPSMRGTRAAIWPMRPKPRMMTGVFPAGSSRIRGRFHARAGDREALPIPRTSPVWLPSKPRLPASPSRRFRPPAPPQRPRRRMARR